MRPHTRRVVRFITELLGIEPNDPTQFVGAEIGVWRGHSSQSLLEQFPGLHLTMVDPYMGVGFKSAWTSDMACKEAKEVTEFAASRRRRVRLTSVGAAHELRDVQFDFVFLDANHTYEFVKEDISAWWPLLRSGGVLIGHDYDGRLDQIGKFGVKRAVDEFCHFNDLRVLIKPFLVWAIKKP